MPAPRTLYAKSGDVHLAYQAIGEGKRDIVLVLDWASHLEAVWEQPFVQEFITSLNRYARVLWFDMRGVGLSDRVVEDAVAPEDWMEDVRAVMDSAGSTEATLVAHGHGAQMALMSAATHPDRVASLVLINGFARFSRADDYPAGIPPAAADTLLEGIVQTWGTGVTAAYLGPSIASDPGVQEWYGRVERFAATPGTALAKMRAILSLDVRKVLPLVRAPTLVVQNRDDAFVRAAHGRYLAEHVAMCVECHSERDAAGTIIPGRKYMGGPIPTRPGWAQEWADRAPRNAGLPGYDDAAALRLLTQGAIARDGRQLMPPMPRFRMTPEDAADVIAFLRSIQ